MIQFTIFIKIPSFLLYGRFNVGTVVGSLQGGYNVYKMPAHAPEKRQLLAKVPAANGLAPCWMHAFGLTPTKVSV